VIQIELAFSDGTVTRQELPGDFELTLDDAVGIALEDIQPRLTSIKTERGTFVFDGRQVAFIPG
jgi:hypothetical protein